MFRTIEIFAILRERISKEQLLPILCSIGVASSGDEVLGLVSGTLPLSWDRKMNGVDGEVTIRVNLRHSEAVDREEGEFDLIFFATDSTDSAEVPTLVPEALTARIKIGSYVEFLPVFNLLGIELPESPYLDAERTKWHPGLVGRVADATTLIRLGYPGNFSLPNRRMGGYYLGDLHNPAPNRTVWFC